MNIHLEVQSRDYNKHHDYLKEHNTGSVLPAVPYHLLGAAVILTHSLHLNGVHKHLGPNGLRPTTRSM